MSRLARLLARVVLVDSVPACLAGWLVDVLLQVMHVQWSADGQHLQTDSRDYQLMYCECLASELVCVRAG